MGHIFIQLCVWRDAYTIFIWLTTVELVIIMCGKFKINKRSFLTTKAFSRSINWGNLRKKNLPIFVIQLKSIHVRGVCKIRPNISNLFLLSLYCAFTAVSCSNKLIWKYFACHCSISAYNSNNKSFSFSL